MISILSLVVRVAYLATTTILFSIFLAATIRFHNRRLILITIGTAIFFTHGILSVPELIYNNYDTQFTDTLHLLADLIGLIFILLGTAYNTIFKKTQE